MRIRELLAATCLSLFAVIAPAKAFESQVVIFDSSYHEDFMVEKGVVTSWSEKIIGLKAYKKLVVCSMAICYDRNSSHYEDLEISRIQVIVDGRVYEPSSLGSQHYALPLPTSNLSGREVKLRVFLSGSNEDFVFNVE